MKQSHQTSLDPSGSFETGDIFTAMSASHWMWTGPSASFLILFLLICVHFKDVWVDFQTAVIILWECGKSFSDTCCR